MARDQVVHWKQDANFYSIGESNQNLILDKGIELAANIIAESMYTQWDVSGNAYFLLETFVNHMKNN